MTQNHTSIIIDFASVLHLLASIIVDAEFNSWHVPRPRDSKFYVNCCLPNYSIK